MKEIKALEIIKKKRVNIEYIKCCDTYEQYCLICSYANEINQEEYDLLKELLKCKEDGQGKLIDCNGQVITDESLAKRFQMPFDYKLKKYILSELIKQDKIAIHTPTEENANALLNALDRLGHTWCNFEKLTSSNEYQRYGKNTCYATSIRHNGKTYIEYCSLYFYEKEGYTIVEFADIDLEN